MNRVKHRRKQRKKHTHTRKSADNGVNVMKTERQTNKTKQIWHREKNTTLNGDDDYDDGGGGGDNGIARVKRATDLKYVKRKSQTNRNGIGNYGCKQDRKS